VARRSSPIRAPQTTANTGQRHPRHALWLLALWALTLLAYSNSFRGGLIFDSSRAIIRDPRIREATSANTQSILTQYYWYNSPNGLYRPLTTFSYLFNYAVLGDGTRPAGYHWLNFGIHAVNVSLVYLLALLLLEGAGPAFAVAAIWSLHPILTESVTNVVGRADLLAAFGVLAGLLCYVRSNAASGRRRALWLLALALAAGAGIFSKESGVVILAIVPLYDLAFGGKTPWRSRLPGYLAMGLPVLLYLLLRNQVFSRLPAAAIQGCDNPLVDAGFWTARLTAVKVLGKYLWLLVWPSRLSCDYSYNQIPVSPDWQTILASIVCICLAVAALACYRRARPIFFFIALFFAALAPTANIVMLIGTIMAERFLYLPSIGFAGCLVWLGRSGCRRLRSRWPAARAAAPAALIAIGLALGARTFARNADWADAASLWRSAVAVCPGSYKAHDNLGQALIAPDGAASDAVRHQLEQSLAIMETLPEQDRAASVYANVGFCYRIKADMLEKSGTPNDSDLWYRKALDVLERGQAVDLAWQRVSWQRNQLAGKPTIPTGWGPLYLALGRTYVHMAEPQKAIQAFQRGALLDQSPQFFEDMSATWLSMGNADQAAIALMEGVAMGVDFQSRLASELVELYRRTAPRSCGIAESGGSVNLNVGCPAVHNQLCPAYRNAVAGLGQLRRDADAAATRQTAIATLGCPAEMFR
jgi:tetratricopeptide (TPR) repeat protein